MKIAYSGERRESISRINRLTGTIPQLPSVAIYRKMIHAAISRALKIT